MSPKRIQRKRTKGWRMPPNTVYVGRPTKWGNRFAVGAALTFPFSDAFGPQVKDRAHAVEIFRVYTEITPFFPDWVRMSLAGRDLACWCPLDQPCHADVLLELANSPAGVS